MAGPELDERTRVFLVAQLQRDGAATRLRARIGAGLERWIGTDGWQALVARAEAESRETSPPTDDAEFAAILAIASVLGRQIGVELAFRLLEHACELPDVPPDGGRHA